MCQDDDEISDCAEYHMKSVDRFLECHQTNIYEVYTIKRLGNISPKPWNPTLGKCTSVVRFRSNRPISIVSFGFFGPLEPNCFGKYHMEIELFTEYFFSIAKTQVVTPVHKSSEIFHVKFDNPVPILPCTWYNAKFSLQGPPTGQSEKLYSMKRMKCGEEHVTFKFEEPDSNQLPEIAFTLLF